MKFSATLLAAVAAIPFVNGHIRMTKPSPYGGLNDFDKNPLSADGSNFPCFVGKDQMIFPPEAPSISAGGRGSITLQGSAVHGGGSCQISITYDLQPSASSDFRVLKSFVGNCPLENQKNNLLESDPRDFVFGFEVPPEVAGGKAVLVWTWFNKVGNREMYMRCAPVTVQSSETDKNKIKNFPAMFRANIGNGCKTEDNEDVVFPDTGSNVEAFSKGFAPLGNCGASVPREDTPVENKPEVPKAEPTRKPSENNIGDDDEEEGPVVVAPVPTAPTTSPSAPVASPSAPATLPKDDVKVELPNIKVPVKTPGADTPVVDPPVVKLPSVENPAVEDKPAPSPVAGGDAGADSCEINGQIYCNGESKFYVCNFNKKVDMGSVAAGTKCSNGKITKRNVVRFSSAHLRRRHHHGLKF